MVVKYRKISLKMKMKAWLSTEKILWNEKKRFTITKVIDHFFNSIVCNINHIWMYLKTAGSKLTFFWNSGCIYIHIHIYIYIYIYIYSSFLGNVSITLVDKTYGKNPKRRESYWMRTLKTYAPFGLNIEVSFWRIPCRSKMFLVGLPVWYFFWHIG